MPPDQALALAFVAAALKFSAVPAAAFELLPAPRRAAVEAWLVGKLPQLVRAFLVTLLVLYLSVALLVKAGPYALLVVFFCGGFISLAITISLRPEQVLAYQVVVMVLVLATLIAAALEKWVVPEAWILTLGQPFEQVSAWANAHPALDWFLPDYAGQAFLEHYRQVFRGIEEWLWDWLAFLAGLYFFLTRGVMLLMVVLIQVLLVVGGIAGVLAALAMPPYLFMKFSDIVKRRLQIDKDRIPVGAFFFWATGETMDFGMQVYATFWP